MLSSFYDTKLLLCSALRGLKHQLLTCSLGVCSPPGHSLKPSLFHTVSFCISYLYLRPPPYCIYCISLLYLRPSTYFLRSFQHTQQLALPWRQDHPPREMHNLRGYVTVTGEHYQHLVRRGQGCGIPLGTAPPHHLCITSLNPLQPFKR